MTGMARTVVHQGCASESPRRSGGGDLTTPSGWTNYVSGLTADASGNFLLPEAGLRANEVNFLRLRKEGSSETGYSAPIALITDSTVTTGSANQVRAVSVHRAGNSVTIRWSLLTTNNKAFRLFFRRADNGTTYSLTPQGLPTVTRTVSLDAQALSAPCGSFFLTQIQSNGSDTAESAKADLPSPSSGAAGRVPCGGGSGTGPPPMYSWKNLIHFRDHLFSLRVLTDEAGKREQGTDFFPYGLELVPDGKTAGVLSRAKYTMHDRDEETGIDDMVMRAKAAHHARFLSVDPATDILGDRPDSWNEASYAHNTPSLLVDPLGLATGTGCPPWRPRLDPTVDCNDLRLAWCCDGSDCACEQLVFQEYVEVLNGKETEFVNPRKPPASVYELMPWSCADCVRDTDNSYPEESYLAHMAMNRPSGVDPVDSECFWRSVLDNWEAASSNTYGVAGAAIETFRSGSVPLREFAANAAANAAFDLGPGRALGIGGGPVFPAVVGAGAAWQAPAGGRALAFSLAFLGRAGAANFGAAAGRFALRGGIGAVAQEAVMLTVAVMYSSYHRDDCRQSRLKR